MASYEELAKQHNLSVDAVETLAQALASSNGKMAQFNHPELGGMGQWMPGMVMIGDAFNQGLKLKVSIICEALASSYQTSTFSVNIKSPTGWWPESFGAPTSTGTQNDAHYAVFADKKRVIIKRNEKQVIYDTGSHTIAGASQQQTNGIKTLVFHTATGVVTETELTVVETK